MNTRSKRNLPMAFHNEIAQLLKDFHDELEKQSSNPSGLVVIARKYQDKVLNRQDSTRLKSCYSEKTEKTACDQLERNERKPQKLGRR